jgi:hypothetical protein
MGDIDIDQAKYLQETRKRDGKRRKIWGRVG